MVPAIPWMVLAGAALFTPVQSGGPEELSRSSPTPALARQPTRGGRPVILLTLPHERIDLFRYNRVEGPAVGARVQARLRRVCGVRWGP